MKVIKAIKNIIVGIIVFVFFIFAIAMTILMLNHNDFGVTQINDTTMIMIKTPVSTGNYKKGDVVLVKEKGLEEIAVGDEIFAYKIVKKKVQINVGIVGEIHEKDKAISFENGDAYGADNIAGAAYKVYPEIGNYLSVVQSKWGFLFIILVPNLLIFIYQLYSLVVEIKYGEEYY